MFNIEDYQLPICIKCNKEQYIELFKHFIAKEMKWRSGSLIIGIDDELFKNDEYIYVYIYEDKTVTWSFSYSKDDCLIIK